MIHEKSAAVRQHRIAFVAGLLLSVLTIMPSVYAAESDLCAPFEDTSIDQSLVERMLAAAKDGYLYRIDPKSSKMGFCVDSPIGMVKGNFRKFNGGLALDGEHNQTIVAAEVESLETNRSFLNGLLMSDRFFDAKTFPKLVFISSGFEWISSNRAVLKGELSMHGVTRLVAFYVEIVENDEVGGDSILVKATTTVQRSEFGIKALSPLVSDRVSLCMSVEAERYVSMI